jgi:hypothetical protein
MTGMIEHRAQLGNYVITHDPTLVYDVFKFRRFRLNLIGFLKLPLGISEDALRDVIKGCSVNLLANYLARAERVIAKARV